MKKLGLALLCFVIFTSPVVGEAANSATGDTLLYTVMISDSDQSFNSNMRSTVDHHMGRVVDYYKSRAPSGADFNLETEYHTTSISYSGDYKSDYSHATKAMNSLGYSGPWQNSIEQLVEDKKESGYDQVGVLFIAPQTGRSYMLGAGEAEFTTVYYFNSRGAFASLLDMEDTPSVVYAHELGHIFGAEDEYVEEGNTGYGDISDNPEKPMKRLYPSFNYNNGPSPEESIMASYGTWDTLGWFDIDTPFSQWAQGMIGWRDFDLDGTLDPNDQRMPVNFPEDRKPILNAGIDLPTTVKYTEFDEVNTGSNYDDASLVDSFGFSLISPSGAQVDSKEVNASNYEVQSAELEADVSDSAKPGNWTVNFLYGQERAAWYEIEVIAPLLEISDTELDFGRVNIEDSASEEVNIQNRGKMVLRATEPEISTPENIQVFSDFAIGPLSSDSKSFTLIPSDTGPIEGQLGFQTNDPRNEEVILSLSGFAYAVRHLTATSPDSAKVGEQTPVPVGVQEVSNIPSEFDLHIERNGHGVTGSDFISSEKEAGNAHITFQKYGNYTVTVNKDDTREYVYRSDSTSISIERIVKNFQLDMDISRTEIDPGDEINIEPLSQDEPIRAELFIDGKTQGTGQDFEIQLEDPGNHTLRLEKEKVKTDREIRNYDSVERTVTVSERGIIESILYFISNLV